MSSVCLSRTSSSTIGMASAISTVATTKTRKTTTAPTVVAVCCANVIRLRLTPFSISSMHISITSTLRRTTTPTRPIEKSATATPISSWVLSTARVLPADAEHRDRGDDRGDEQHRRQLEQEPVLGEERDRERADAERDVAELVHRRRQRLPDARDDRAGEDDEAGDPRHDGPRVAADLYLAALEQHDRVDDEDHHRADVDQHLERGDEVDAEQAVDAAEQDHRRHQRERDAHRLAQEEHRHRGGERAERADDEQQRVELAQQAFDRRH